MNVGNIDITHTDQSVTLRMRHVVEGHPGAVLSFNEIDTLCAELKKAKKAGEAAPKRSATGVDLDKFSMPCFEGGFDDDGEGRVDPFTLI